MVEAKSVCGFCELIESQKDLPIESRLVTAYCLGRKSKEAAAKEPPLCVHHEVMIAAMETMISTLAARHARETIGEKESGR